MESDRIAKALESLSETLQSDPLKGPATYATATARLVDGLRCRVTGPSGEQLESLICPNQWGVKARPLILAGFSERPWLLVAPR